MKKHLLSMYADLCKINSKDGEDIISYGPTILTESRESSDPDEFLLQEPTKLTFTLESTDSDEFLSELFSNSNEKDFDEILLI